jgi:hypothetical protein
MPERRTVDRRSVGSKLEKVVPSSNKEIAADRDAYGVLGEWSPARRTATLVSQETHAIHRL